MPSELTSLPSSLTLIAPFRVYDSSPNFSVVFRNIDYLKEEGQSFDPMVVDDKEIEYIKLVSYHRQKYSGHEDKIVFYEMDSIEASKKVEDKSLDFIFIDSYCSFEQAKDDIKVWYPKVKDGGIFAGHDWNMPLVRLAVTKFRENENINSRMSTYDDTWIWYK